MTKFLYTRQGRTTALGGYSFDSETPTEVEDQRLVAKLKANPYFEEVTDTPEPEHEGNGDAHRNALEEEAEKLGIQVRSNMRDDTLERKIAEAKADG